MVRYAMVIHVTKDQSSKLMEHASSVHHIPGHLRMVTYVCQIIAMLKRNLLRMVLAKSVKSIQENKVMEKPALLINVTTDKRFLKMVHVKLVGLIPFYRKIKEAVSLHNVMKGKRL